MKIIMLTFASRLDRSFVRDGFRSKVVSEYDQEIPKTMQCCSSKISLKNQIIKDRSGYWGLTDLEEVNTSKLEMDLDIQGYF